MEDKKELGFVPKCVLDVAREPGMTMNSYVQIATFKDRIIQLSGEITDETALSVRLQILSLSKADPELPIEIDINSGGGSVVAGNSIVDTMDLVPNPIITVCVGLAASMAAIILAHGTKGYRGVTKNSSVMIHQISYGIQGNNQDIDKTVDYSRELNRRALSLLAADCGKTYDQIKKDTERDHFMFAEDSLAYGIVDKIVQPKEKTTKALQG